MITQLGFHPSRLNTRGFTIIELLVVMSIFWLMVGLLLPVIQAMRESARRVQRANHHRQIGLAVQGYHETFGSLPRGRQITSDPRDMVAGISCLAPVDRSLHVAILPYLDQFALYNSIPDGSYILARDDQTALSFVVSVYACPSDADAGVPRAGELDEPTPWPIAEFDSIVMTSYARVMGSTYAHALPDLELGCRVDPVLWNRSDGCLNDVSPVAFASITDGLSTTMVVVEKATTILRNAKDIRFSRRFGWWFLGEIGHSLVVATDPPNVHKRYPARFAINWTSGASSMHPGGVHALFADGSVRFVGETIQSTPYHAAGPRTPGVWQGLATRNGGKLISHEAF